MELVVGKIRSADIFKVYTYHELLENRRFVGQIFAKDQDELLSIIENITEVPDTEKNEIHFYNGDTLVGKMNVTDGVSTSDFFQSLSDYGNMLNNA